MITLFRKIRQKMLNENKVSKYLLYAIGEIALVMIGILLALQVNNWNKNRKDSIEEKAILESLLENLTDAKKQSESFILEENILKISLMQILGIDANQRKNSTVVILKFGRKEG